MRRHLPFFIVILAVVSAVYYSVWSGGLLRDDYLQITENPWITSPSYIPEIFTSTHFAYYHGDFIVGTSNYYRPVMHLLYMAQYAVFGTNPVGYHGVNLLFHVLNAFLVFIIASSMLTPSRGRSGAATGGILALGAALLFALHPANAEAVVWIGVIGELSYTFFFLLAFYLFMLNGQGRGASLYVASVLLYVIALFSKDTALVVAPLFGFYALSEGRPAVSALKRGAPYIVAAAAFFVLRSTIVGPLSAQHAMGPYEYVLSVLGIAAQYTEKLILPFAIKLYYPFHTPGSFRDILSHELAVFALALAGCAYWIFKDRSRRTVSFFFLWIAIPLSPPVLMVKYIQGEWVFASRYLYLSTAALAILAAVAVSRAMRDRELKATVALACLVVFVPFALESARAARYWADEFSFWKKAAEDAPMSATAHASLAVAYGDKKMYREAIREYESALALAPESVGVYTNLGVVYYNLKEMDRAIDAFTKALAYSKDPGKAAAINLKLGLMYLEKGSPGDAVRHLEDAVSGGVEDSNAYNMLGVAYARTGDKARAYGAFGEAVRLDPRNASARGNLERLANER